LKSSKNGKLDGENDPAAIGIRLTRNEYFEAPFFAGRPLEEFLTKPRYKPLDVRAIEEAGTERIQAEYLGEFALNGQPRFSTDIITFSPADG
jgi:hypothetical protein